MDSLFDKAQPDLTFSQLKIQSGYPELFLEELILVGKLSKDATIKSEVDEIIKAKTSVDILKVWKDRKKIPDDFDRPKIFKILCAYAALSATLDIGKMSLLLGCTSYFFGKSKEELPDELGRFNGIEEISIYTNDITKLPATIGSLTSLKKLSIKSGISSIPAEVSKLVNLKKLELTLSNFTEFPREICAIPNLKKLSINGNDFTYNTNISFLPSDFNQLKKLKSLSIAYLQLPEFPAHFFELPNLRKLRIARIKGIKTLPASIGKAQRLKSLEVFTSDAFERFPEEMNTLVNLKEFRIGSLPALKEISGDIVYGPAMELFSIGDCIPVITKSNYSVSQQKLLRLDNEVLYKNFVENISFYQNLEELQLSISSDLKLPDTIGDLPQLKKLTISSNTIEHLPAGIGACKHLVYLKIYSTSLKSISDLSQIESLKDVQLECSALEFDPTVLPVHANTVVVKALAFIQSENNTRNIQSLDVKVERMEFRYPEALTIRKLVLHSVIPENIDLVRGMEELHAFRPQLVVPECIGNISTLRYLNVYGGYNFNSSEEFIKHLPSSLGRLSQLETLSITGAMSEDLLFLESLISLKNLKLTFFPNLKTLPEFLVKLPNLQRLSINNMDALTNISTLARLSHLTHLNVDYVNTLTPAMLSCILPLNGLEFLRLGHWPLLTNLPAEISTLEKLKCLSLASIPVKEVPREIGSLKKLETLGLVSLSGLRTLPAALSELNLKCLVLGTTRFTELPDAFLRWKLEKLSMWFSKFSGYNMKQDVYSKLLNSTTVVTYKDYFDSMEIIPEGC